jgi:hypothetical protein
MGDDGHPTPEALRIAALEAFRMWAEPLLATLQPPPPQLSAERAALLVALARRMKRPDETFLVRDVLKLMPGDPGLAVLVDAVAAPGKGQGRELGKVFREMVGISAAGLVFRATEAVDHRSRYWTIELAPGGGEWPGAIPPSLFSTWASARHSGGDRRTFDVARRSRRRQ